MILDSRNADAVRRLMQSGKQDIGLDRATAFTLPGLLDLIATAACSNGNEELRRYLDSAAQSGAGALGIAWRTWSTPQKTMPNEDLHGIRPAEFFRLRVREDQTGSAYQLFQERFVRSMKHVGFPRVFAEALSGAMVEMTDNVIQHSLSAPGEYTGMAGYCVEQDYASFGVTDIGQGILASFSTAPDWKNLQTTEDALKAVIYDHASSRPDQPRGEGFRTLIRALVDRNCRMRFRSNNAALCIRDTDKHREGVIISSPPLNGFQMSVCCSLRGKPEEKPIKEG